MEDGGELWEGAPGVGYANVRHVPPGERGRQVGFADNGHRPPRDALGEVIVRVGARSLASDEEAAWPHVLMRLDDVEHLDALRAPGQGRARQPQGRA